VLIGLAFCDPGAWPVYLVVLVALTLEWPFCIQLTEGVEIYLPVAWTSAAAAYALGLPVLPLAWLSATAGFALIGVLDRWRIAPAKGLAAEGLKRYRGEQFAPGSHVGGLLRQFLSLSAHALRVGANAAVGWAAPGLPFVAGIAAGEAAVALWMRLAPVRGRVGPGSTRGRIAAALGRDMLAVTDLLQVVMACFLVLAFRHGGAGGLAAASAATLILHALLKRLADARLESERRRLDLVAMRDALERRQRLAAVGHTASMVFHQIARQHGAIGIFAHLLARGPNGEGADAGRYAATVRDHAEQILASLEEAKRVIDELLRFGQDRALNLYPHSLRELVAECVQECLPAAGKRSVELVVSPGADTTIPLDKHKLKQALGNVLDNAIEVTPVGARVEIEPLSDAACVRIEIRDYGPGVEPAIRPRLFTPFCTTKPHGIGLGLALARELVEAHGGTIEWTEAAPGTTFVLTVPREPRTDRP
jgi:signal transduction histidine kinase